jgi:sec-independent protein translocase protein TatC
MAGALDEDTAKTLASGRQTVGSMLSAAQDHLKRVFLVFVVGMLLTIWALRAFVWDRLKSDLVFNRMTGETADATQIVVTSPFDVILLQVKIGLIVGVIVSIPVLIWYSRDGLKRRGIWPDARIPLWKKVSFVLAIAFLFTGGVSYGYFFFFPVMFDFLATNAVNAGFKPTWSIVKWTEFVFFLSLSFGVAAQLPLAMSASARAGVIPYETFRDKWRYAVVGIFIFGAMFSPPDPFTQVMWGVPLVVLYFISLGVTKLAVLSKRAGDQVSTRAIVRDHWNQIAGAAVTAVAAIYLYLLEGGARATNDLLESVGSSERVAVGDQLGAFGLSPTAIAVLVGSGVALVVAVELIFYFRVLELERRASEQARREAAEAVQPEQAAEESEPGEPAEIDIGAMSARAVQAASPEAFLELSEERSIQYAQQAIDNDNPQKAQAILDKFDEAQELDIDPDEGDDEDDQQDDEEENVVTSTAAGMVDPFTEDETTEDDIGGYYYDIAFILESLTSKAIWIVATFMIVLAGSFMWMYTGGIGAAADVFFQNMPEGAVEEPEIVVLHPVEALIFMLKFSTLLAFLSVVPLLVYFAWPAVEDRGITSGDRSVLATWGILMFVVLFGGTAVGFLYIAPAVISLLAWDVVNANMVIAYRISSFGWLVILLTVGIGALTMIPVTMVLFEHGNIVSYERMRKSWRGVVLAFFAIAGLLTPSGVFTMFIVVIPASFAYGLGIGLTWLYTRVESGARALRGEPAD